MYVRGDGAALPFINAFDAVFSAATFHWIPDHQRLFNSIFGALKPRGRLVAQAGGVGNLATLYGRAWDLMQSPDTPSTSDPGPTQLISKTCATPRRGSHARGSMTSRSPSSQRR